MSESEFTQKRYARFDVAQRVEHVVLLLSFTLLAVTGLPQKYPLSPISQFIITGLGGIEAVRILHRINATLFILLSVYHAIVVGYKLFVLRKEASMLPGIKDVRDVIQFVGFNLGIVKERPKMPRYNFMEKAEYWAMLWGLILMGLTGFMLWNPIATTRVLPGVFVPAAKAAHGAEAVLAVLAIIIWHFYNVHVKFWNWSMIKGSLSRHEMEEEHGLELEKLEKGEAPVPATPEQIRKRMRIFVPVAGVISLALVAVVLRFVTFEQSAITTLPESDRVQVYLRQTPTPAPTQPPTPTAAPTQEGSGGGAVADTWDSAIGAVFKARCGACHGSMGGLNVSTYADLMKGGAKGVVITPGDAANSLAVKTVAGGAHPGKFTPEELAKIEAWIQAGAPEK